MSMFDIYNMGKPAKIRKLTYDKAYPLWYALLSNKCLNLFKWTGLPFEQKELEIRAQLFGNGICGIAYSGKYNRIIACNAAGVGVTEYPDKWDKFIWTCPGDSGMAGVNETGVIVYNNSSMLPTRMLVERYAHLLAHAELSLQAILINTRSTGILAARNEKQKQDIADFYNCLEDGRTMAIVDDSGLDTLIGSEGLRAISTAYPSSTHIMDFWQIRQNLYKEFLAELGISKSTDKRERLIKDEVLQDVPLYQYSLDDMLNCRKIAADYINKVFGLDVSVEINPAITALMEEGDTDVTE